MGFFDRIMGRDLPERRDGRKIYFRLLEQSRNPALFKAGGFADDYDGRIDAITLHMAVFNERLATEGEDGVLLRQALFDEMKDDFEVALREEGIADTGVKRRIKPMIGHFYDRLKAYSDALKSDAPKTALKQAFILTEEKDQEFASKLADYSIDFLEQLKSTDFKALTATRFYFPEL